MNPPPPPTQREKVDENMNLEGSITSKKEKFKNLNNFLVFPGVVIRRGHHSLQYIFA